MSKTRTQSDALELAEFFGSMKKSSHRWYDGVPVHEKAAAELRRLDAENKALRERLEAMPVAPADPVGADEVECVCGATWERHGHCDYEMVHAPRKAAPAADAELLDFLQQTATAVEVLAQDEGEPARFLVGKAISKQVRGAIGMARGRALAAQAAAKNGDAA